MRAIEENPKLLMCQLRVCHTQLTELWKFAESALQRARDEIAVLKQRLQEK